MVCCCDVCFHVLLVLRFFRGRTILARWIAGSVPMLRVTGHGSSSLECFLSTRFIFVVPVDSTFQGGSSLCLPQPRFQDGIDGDPRVYPFDPTGRRSGSNPDRFGSDRKGKGSAATPLCVSLQARWTRFDTSSTDARRPSWIDWHRTRSAGGWHRCWWWRCTCGV